MFSAIAIVAIATAFPHTLTAKSASVPRVSLNVVYYAIQGSTAEELRSQINQNSPVDVRSSRRYAAYTEWEVSWYYRSNRKSHECSLNSPQINTAVRMTLPRWTPPANAPAPLKTQWNRYLKALRLHEEGHQQHGIKAGQEILQILKQMPTFQSCQILASTANREADQIIKKYNQQDISYDQRTKHGAMQGAVFP